MNTKIYFYNSTKTMRQHENKLYQKLAKNFLTKIKAAVIHILQNKFRVI